MGNFHIHSKGKSNDVNFIDRVAAEIISVGGVVFHIYKYLGPDKNPGSTDLTKPAYEDGSNVTDIGDYVLMETANRRYSKEVYEMWGHVQMNTNQFVLMQMGLSILDSDVKEITFHYNEMVRRLNRRLMPGDVIEATFMRDMDLLDDGLPAINRFYVVDDSFRPDDGWSLKWHQHLWRVKCSPLINSPEFKDIFNSVTDENGNPVAGIGDSADGGEGASNAGNNSAIELAIMDVILDQAEAEVSFVGRDEHNLWVDLDAEGYVTIFCEYNGVVGNDGIPANMNWDEVDTGKFFPASPVEGDWFLRTDYDPPRLFRYEGGNYWRLMEFNNRHAWTGLPKPYEDMVNNKLKFTNDEGIQEISRRGLAEVVKAKTEVRDKKVIAEQAKLEEELTTPHNAQIDHKDVTTFDSTEPEELFDSTIDTFDEE